MKKVVIFFLVGVSCLIFAGKAAWATSCGLITVSPGIETAVNTITVHSNDVFAGNKYTLKISSRTNVEYPQVAQAEGSVEITVTDYIPYGRWNVDLYQGRWPWWSKLCGGQISIAQGMDCEWKLVSAEKPIVGQPITLTLNSALLSRVSNYEIRYLDPEGTTGNPDSVNRARGEDLATITFTPRKLPGVYRVLFNIHRLSSNRIENYCAVAIRVGQTKDDPNLGIISSGDTWSEGIAREICNVVPEGKNKEACKGCFGAGKTWTALGCIPTNDLNLFVGWVLGKVIFIATGIAFLLLAFGAFQILTSAGNPEKVKAGSELLTSTISGLLLIILSLFLLRLIGIDILQIPGFGK